MEDKISKRNHGFNVDRKRLEQITRLPVEFNPRRALQTVPYIQARRGLPYSPSTRRINYR